MKLRFVPAGVAVALLAIACPPLHSQTPNPDWTITGPAPVNNSTLTISVSRSHAGAITSLKLGNDEFVDNYDHGRQIQGSIQLNGEGEYYNPNEAGTLYDLTSSTSELLGLSIPSANRLMTTTDMAYWFVQNQGQPLAVPYSNAPPDGQLTQFVFQKDVTIGPSGLPGNVIEYLSTFHPSVTTPPEAVTSSIASAAAYLKPSQFTQAWTYDLATRTLLQHQDGGGADDRVKVMVWPRPAPLSPLALAAYAPENIQPYGDGSGSQFGWWLPPGPYPPAPSTFLHASNPASGPLPVSYRVYFVVGNTGEVKSSLDALDLKFASLDPDVFTWREYLRLNNLPLSWTRANAQSHWLNTGLPNGFAASYRFALGRYRNLNSDQSGKSNQAVIDHYIQLGRKQGRNTSPRAEGGLQHTLVRSLEQNFVPVRVSGGNSYGQLGNGTTTGTASPIRLPNFGTGQRVTDVAAGDFTSLAVLADGTVWMWGSNANGARGNGTIGGPNQLTPVQVPNLPPIVVPSAKDRHVVAAGQNAYAVVDNNGSVWTWGYGGNGQLGRGNANSYYTPGQVMRRQNLNDPNSPLIPLTGITSIAIGGGNMMAALDIDEHVWTWGSNLYGALGNNTTTNSYTAVQALTAINDCNTCAPDPNRPPNAPCPVALPCYKPLGGITQVVTGGAFCMALQRNGQIWAWGHNSYGQLGDKTFTTRTAAVQVPIPGRKIDKIAVGGYHALAHSDHNGRIYVWGYNGYGALGLPPGYPVSNSTPIALPVSDATSNITDVGAGVFTSFLIRANATEQKIFGCGDNQSGQLGLNHYMTQTTPDLTSF